MAKTDNHPTPWRVYDAELRPKPFNTRVVEIHDANGYAVIPWSGFDQKRGSHTAKVLLARRICRAINGRN